MLRRKHKKSRNGCTECKRRHYKCDEKHPVCTNCEVSERNCNYPRAVSVTRNAPPGDSSGVDSGTGSPVTPENNAPPRPDSVRAASELSRSGTQAAEEEDLVNVDHIRFLLHFSMDIIVPEIAPELKQLAQRLTMEAAVAEPFLLYEVLAISARHLATIDAANAESYRRQATRLQTRAIQLFNSVEIVFDNSNAIAAVFFSSYLGRHTLADTLNSRDTHIDAFLSKYADYVQVHRGLRVVAQEAWPTLEETDFKPLMAFNPHYETVSARGHDFDPLATVTANSSDLDHKSINQCLNALHYLQIAKDELSDPRPRTLMMFVWCLLCEQPFTEMLVRKQPIALVILGHYAGLLYFVKDSWQVGDAGRYILGLVSDSFGPDWAQHLAWPRSVFPA